MRTITKYELKAILESHQLWLRGEVGERANLRSANLRSANLSYADLSYANLSYANLSSANLRSADLSYADLITTSANCAIGNMREIKTVLLDTWSVTYTADHLHIGCERHLITEWWDFDDDRIARMDIKALEWWKKWKAYIQQTIELSPATPTGNKESDAAA